MTKTCTRKLKRKTYTQDFLSPHGNKITLREQMSFNCPQNIRYQRGQKKIFFFSKCPVLTF